MLRTRATALAAGLAATLFAAQGTASQKLVDLPGAIVLTLPADTTVAVGDTLTLRVVCGSVSDLKAFQLVHRHDRGRLASVAVEAGDVLTGSGRDFFAYVLMPKAAPSDTTWLDAAMLQGTTSGPGVLATLRFVALVPGAARVTPIHVELRDSHNRGVALREPWSCVATVHVVPRGAAAADSAGAPPR